MQPVDYHQISKDVYDFAASQAPLAPLVKEALGVIDDALECFGYAALLFCSVLESNESTVTKPGTYIHKL